MTDMIVGPIIGALIAGIIGLGTILLQNYLNKKKEQSLIVNDLLVEVQQNWKICVESMPPNPKVEWWLIKYKTDVYNSWLASSYKAPDLD